MSCRKDPLLKELNRLFRATALKMPETRIKPLDLFGLKKKQFSYRGQIKFLLDTTVPLDYDIGVSELPLQILGNKVSNIDASVGLSFLDGLIKGLSGNSASLNAAFDSSTKLTFEFLSPIRKFIDINQIGQLFSQHKFNLANPGLAPFASDDAKMLIITSTIVCNQFLMGVSETKNSSVGISIPVLDSLISDLDAAVKIEVESDRMIKVTSSNELTFALTAAPITFDKQTGKILSIGLDLAPGAIPQSVDKELDVLKNESLSDITGGDLISWS